MEVRVSNYYKPNKENNTRSVNIIGQRQVKNERKPSNNTERVTPAKPIPQPIKKAEGLANILSINEPNVPSLNDVVFPLDKTPIENWVNYSQKVYGKNDEPLTDIEKKVGNAVESSMENPTKVVKAKPKDKWEYTSRVDEMIAADKLANQPEVKKSPRMSAARSWNLIKKSMNKDEIAEWYKDHPEDKPAEYKPYKPDPYITAMLGEDY